MYGYLCFELGAWIETEGFRRYLYTVKKNSFGNFSLNSARVRTLGWPLLAIFRDFSKKKKFKGSVGQMIFREYIVFGG